MNRKSVRWVANNSQLRRVAAEAMGDSIRSFGIGIFDRDEETSALSAAIHEQVWPFREVMSPREFESLKVAVKNFPPLAQVKSWSRVQCLAACLRFHGAVVAIGMDGLEKDLRLHRIAASARANQKDGHRFRGARELHNVVRSVMGIGDRELQWQDRILIEDIYEAFSRRVLTGKGILEDFWALAKPMLDLGTNDADEWQAGKYDFADARKAMIEAMEPRLEARQADCQDALDELCAAAAIDHQWIADLGIDARCVELGISGTSGVHISLGKKDFMRIFPAFSARLMDDEAIRRVAKDPIASEQSPMPPGTVGPESQAFPARSGDPTVPDDTFGEELGFWMRAIMGYGQLPNARGVFVWRGTKRSAARASQEVSRAIRTGVMTGWLAASGDEHVISFVGNANYDPGELDLDRTWRLEGAVREGVPAQSIEAFPETFPIAEFLQTSVSGMSDVARESTKSYRFVAGALRLLGDCDAMLSSFPAQAFVAAMSAVEACVGGKGSDLAKTVARRCGRLLVDDLRLRASADQFLSDLYDHRSRIVHGEQCDTSTKDAVLMRYVASCVVFNCAGLARAMGRLDDDAGAKSVIRALDQDNYGQSLMPGVTRSSYLLRILSEGYRFASRG